MTLDEAMTFHGRVIGRRANLFRNGEDRLMFDRDTLREVAALLATWESCYSGFS